MENIVIPSFPLCKWFMRATIGAPRLMKTLFRDLSWKRLGAIAFFAILGLALAGAMTWLLYDHALFHKYVLAELLRRAAAKNPPWIIISGIAAAPSLLLTWYWRTVHKDAEIELAGRTERNERFADAVRLMSEENPKEASRLGGIYTLEALARISPPDQDRIRETLCAFVRSRGTMPTAPDQMALHTQPADVQAAFSVMGRTEGPPAYLERALLPKISGTGARLRRAHLGFSNLEQANLSKADLSEAVLVGSRLAGADLSEANLSRANFFRAKLDGAQLEKADLRGANIGMARFDNANLTGAQFDNSTHGLGASFLNAKLPDGFDPSALAANPRQS